MKTLALLVIHILTTLAQRVGPGGTKAIIAESVLLKHQQLIARRSVGKTPRLTKFRSALLSRNYHRLFSSRKTTKPGPKGPADDLIRVIVEMKQRNAGFGCPRIAQQINKAFGVNIDKDVVRRVLAKHYRPAPYDGGPSWLTFLKHTRESLCSVVLFRRESILPKFHSILLAIGQCTRRIIGCAISGCRFNQSVVCSLFDNAIPVIDASRSLRSIHDQAFSHYPCRRKHLGLRRTRTVTILPRSPPFAERRFRTRRRNHHDYRSNCSAIDLATEHEALNNYYHLFRMPNPLDGNRAARFNIETALSHAESPNFTRKRYIREELRTLIAA